jgi:hypothetical protein
MVLMSTTWFSQLLVTHPYIGDLCSELGIIDEQTYSERQSLLTFEIEILVAQFRVEQRTGGKLSTTNIIDNLDVCPHWLLSSPVSDLNLSVRPANVLGRAKVVYIGQLVELGVDGILNLRHMGQKSYVEICDRIVSYFYAQLANPTSLSHGNEKKVALDVRQRDLRCYVDNCDLPLSRREDVANTSVHKNWIAEFQSKFPEDACRLQQFGVFDAFSYDELEPTLPTDLRLSLAHFKYSYYVETAESTSDVLDNLSFMPQWLLDSPIAELGLSVRPSNVFGQAGIKTIGDLRYYGSLGVSRLRNMGVGSYNEVVHKINEVFSTGTVRLHKNYESFLSLPGIEENHPISTGNNAIDNEQHFSKFSQCWAVIKQLCNDREIQVLELRNSTVGNKGQSLGEIGKILGISRERVRQVEVSVRIRIHKSAAWKCIISHICTLFDSRTIPLEVRFLELEDEWFDAIEPSFGLLTHLITTDGDLRLNVLDIDGATVLALISVEQWQELLSEGESRLRLYEQKAIKSEALYEHITFEVRCLAPYLEDIFWFELTKNAVWSTNNDGDKIFLTTDYSVESLIHCVLELSDKPLHYKSICALVNGLDCLKKYTEERIHNVLVDSFILYGTGTYGLAKHCPLSDLDLKDLLSRLESIIRRGPIEKQWHSDELRDRISLCDVHYVDSVTSHIVSYVLSLSSNVVGLRRMVWGNRGQWNDNAEARIDVLSIVSGIILDAGKPLTTHEIRITAAELRGLSNVFQVHSKSPVIQLGPSLWGLEGRDIDIAPYECLVTKLYDSLTTTNTPQHISVIKDVLTKDFKLNFFALSVICRRNGIKIDQAHYVSLSGWSGDSNPIGELLLQKLSECIYGVKLRDLHTFIETTLGHPIDKQVLSSLLQHINARYDDYQRLWFAN